VNQRDFAFGLPSASNELSAREIIFDGRVPDTRATSTGNKLFDMHNPDREVTRQVPNSHTSDTFATSGVDLTEIQMR
jgi:hypothetical protein